MTLRRDPAAPDDHCEQRREVRPAKRMQQLGAMDWCRRVGNRGPADWRLWADAATPGSGLIWPCRDQRGLSEGAGWPAAGLALATDAR
jgi:hypothetical protein